MLKEIYEFNELDLIITPLISDADIIFTEMRLLFVESKKNDIIKILNELEKQNIDENSSIIIGSFESFIKVLTEVKKIYGIKSVSVAFSKMIDICKREIENNKLKKKNLMR
ncbi:MAG TPA: hypothetical protein PLA73_01325 [Sedimentibacter sp.]|nr:hypothetical protein [Sedimentibacter sp.]